MTQSNSRNKSEKPRTFPPNFLISATRKSSGKTTISLGLAAAFYRRNLKVQTFKKGPDYIDPLWLQQASRRDCFNLDFNTQSHDEIISTFVHRCADADLAIIESNKGLFDGVDLEGRDSNAQLAKLLKSPVILVVDTLGITRGIAPLLHGYCTFDSEIEISGIILNKTGGSRHESKLRSAVEHYSDIAVLGSIGRDERLVVNERHLGLTTPGEISGAMPLIERLADTMENSLDIDAIFNIASTTGPNLPAIASPLVGKFASSNKDPGIVIAVARDEAFGFHYADDLEALRQAGARLHFFSPLRDAGLPQADGLFIAGGFPETHMEKLQANLSLRSQIKSAIEAGLPTYGECGGLMYLSRSIKWDGKSAQMVGMIPGDCIMHDKPQGRGFSKLQKTNHHPWYSEIEQSGDGELTIPAHEFHYASLANLPSNICYAFDIKRGHGIDGNNDGIVLNNMLANFCHLRNTHKMPWAGKFVDFVRKCKYRP